MRSAVRLRPWSVRSLVLSALLFLTPGLARAELKLFQPDPAESATFVGHGGYSADGLGQNGVGKTVQAEVPAGSTVVQAYLYASYHFTGVPSLAQRTINFDGSTVILQALPHVPPLGGALNAARGDVTAQVAAKVQSGGGIFDFAINTDPPNMDGVALVVIFENPALPLTTIAVLDGGATQGGDTATFNFAGPLDKTIPDFRATMSLGIGFGFQGVAGHACGGGQFSRVDVNNQRLTSCAGNFDDGLGNNGALITVGGVGDSTDNPANPNVTSGIDDELYNLEPFLHQDDAQLTIKTSNPSADDIVFLAVIAITAEARVTTEICNNNRDDDRDGLIDRADPDCQICGDGILDPAEQCDDGNTNSGDGCSNRCELEDNDPPVALCQNADLLTDPGACTASASIDAGSFDPDADPITLVQAPPAPYGVGATPVTLTVTDPLSHAATCSATVTVSDQELPDLRCNAPPAIQGDGAPVSYTPTATDNCAAALAVTITSPLCFNGDIDGDGVPNDEDECRKSDVRPTVVIDTCITSAPNALLPGGCTLADLAGKCGETSKNHGQYVSCVSHLTNEWKAAGLITGMQKGEIVSCAARAPIPASNGLAVAFDIAEDEKCAVEVEGGVITFPDPPPTGFFRWTATATDPSGNVATTTCEVAVEAPSPTGSRPYASAGPDRIVTLGQTAQLDGSGSVDVDGDPLTFRWRFLSKPAGSAAELSDAAAVQPTFTVDASGVYQLELVVNDGTRDSAPDTVVLTTANVRPVANAGPDQTVFVTQTVQLDASGSSDANGDPLTYSWLIAFKPEGSAAALSDATAVRPTFTVDLPGFYAIQLVVHDGTIASFVDTVVVSTQNSPPVANAGPDRTAFVTEVVRLDGSASSDVDGDSLTFRWSLVTKPAASAAALSDPAAVDPQITIDKPGTYVAQLIVSDGFADSAADTVTITTVNSPPVANAGADRTAFVTDRVQLNGSASSDVDGDLLTFQWSLITKPAGSVAAISNPALVNPEITIDKPGTYVAQLIVNDGTVDSAPDTVVITTLNSQPVARAGADQTAFVTNTVQLDGSASSDVDGDPLTFRWAFTSRPTGSTAALSSTTAVRPTFVVDKPGTYVVQLVVNDGVLDSAPDTVVITTLNSAPVANAGPDQTAFVTATVQLDGSASSDVDGNPLTYAWSFTSRPAGSTATLSGATAVTPTFVVDRPGTYVVQLIVRDGALNSAPDTVVITTLNSRPVADAGPDQTALAGDTIQLDGTGSHDVDGDPLTYQWSLTAVPAGSAAVLSDPAATQPTFVADIAGTYVAQLLVRDAASVSDPDTVVVIVSDAPVPVPDVVGQTQAQAQSAIVAAGLSVGTVTTASSPTVPAGRVISQSPAAGTSVLPGSAVDLVVSAGPVLVPVPNVVGQTQAQAESSILAAGLMVGAVSTEPSATVPEGRVIRQAPEGGTTAPQGSPVNLVISAGNVSTEPIVEILVTPADPVLLEGDAQAFQAIGILADGSSRNVTGSAVWTSSDGGVATVSSAGFATAVAAGSATVSASLDGITGATGVTVEARTTGGTPPLAAITSPAANAAVIEPVDVIGTASDADFLKYELEVSPAGQGAWTLLATGTTPVVNGVLGTLDPTLLINDLYDLRLRVYDRSGFVTTTAAVNQVAGEQKIGNFSITFKDLEVPVAGLPITVNRVYDSRDKARGDFGIGWRLDIQTLRLKVNRVHGSAWTVEKSGGLIPVYRLIAADNHKVSLTLPDGRVEEFDLSPSPAQQQLVPLQFVTAAYVPRPGTLGTLQPLGNTGLIVLGSQPGAVDLVDDSTFDLYDPKSFRYTSPQGETWVIDRQKGVQSVRDTNGNTLTITASGIVHSAGRSISIQRDGLGRVISITDPNGAAQTYAYDANGDLVRHTDREGNETRFFYNFRHGLLEIEDPRGVSPLRYEYDDDGRLIATVDAEGNRVEISHDLGARQEIVRDRRGNPTVVSYDESGRVLAEVDAQGNTVSFTYDAAGNRLTETDELGKTTSYTYDAQRNVLSRTDPLGGTTTYTYNARGQVLTATDPLGNKVTNTYDGAGNLLTSTDDLGNVTTNTYDAQGRLLTSRDALGNTTTRQYDGAGNLVEETDPLGLETTFTYDANGNELSRTFTRTDEAGNPVTVRTSKTYDSEGRVLTETDAAGNVTASEYDPLGKLLAVTDRNGNRTEYEYDVRGNQIRTAFADGTAETATYDEEGNKLTSTDRAGRTARFEYDALNRLTRTVLPDGSIIRKEYDAAGRVSAEIDGRGNRTSQVYDAAGRAIEVTDPLGHVTTYAYDAKGNRLSMTDALGHTTGFEYDALDRLTRTVFHDGTFIAIAYDALGQKSSETDQAGNTRQYRYDADGNLVRVIDALGNETAFTYDEAGNKVAQTDANGHVTRWAYDNVRRVVRHTLPLGMEATFSHDDNGNLISRTDFNAETTTLVYDSSNRLIEKNSPDGSSVLYTYTASGKVATVTDGRGTTTYGYDAMDRLAEVEEPDGTRVTYTYDAAGNRTSMTAPSGTTTHTYDALNRLATVTAPDGGVTAYSYDAVGNLAGTTYPNGISASYTYDALNRLVRLDNLRPDSTEISSYAYTLGAAGNRLQVAEGSGRVVTYTYDPLLRLTREQIVDPVNGNDDVSYTYDAVGNRLTRTDSGGTVTSAYDDNDRLLSAGAAAFTYDDNGNTLSRAEGSEVTTYAYDAENRLIAAQTPDRSLAYTYDHAGLRVSAAVDGQLTRYVVDRNGSFAQVIEERDGSGSLTVRYVHGHDLISQSRGGTVRYYHYDGVGSTRALTDAAASTTDTYDYDSFGILLGSTGSTVNDFLFAGEQLDANLGLYYLRARYLDPTTGRFFTSDPFSGSAFDPVTLHRYLYAGANPISNIDPGGEQFLSDIGMAIQIRMITIAMAFPRLTSVIVTVLEALVPMEVAIAMPNFSVASGVGALAILKAGSELGTMRQLFQRLGGFPGLGTTFEAWVGKVLNATKSKTIVKDGMKVLSKLPGSAEIDFLYKGTILEVKLTEKALKENQAKQFAMYVQSGGANGVTYVFFQKPSPAAVEMLEGWIKEVAPDMPVSINWIFP